MRASQPVSAPGGQIGFLRSEVVVWTGCIIMPCSLKGRTVSGGKFECGIGCQETVQPCCTYKLGRVCVERFRDLLSVKVTPTLPYLHKGNGHMLCSPGRTGGVYTQRGVCTEAGTGRETGRGWTRDACKHSVSDVFWSTL